MPRNTNRKRLQAVRSNVGTVKAAATKTKVHRTTLYRWKNAEKRLEEAVKKSRLTSTTSTQLLELQSTSKTLYWKSNWIVEMRKSRFLCVSMECLLLVLARFDAERCGARTRSGNTSFLRRFLKRNRLSIRRITHKGRKRRPDMELVANVFSQSIQRAIEEDGILSSQPGPDKLGNVYNMDQTAIFIDMGGNTTIDFTGSVTVDVHQGSETNGLRASVFLTASATGKKLRPLLVFAGVPGGAVSGEVWDPSFGDNRVDHTVQQKAYCNEAVMQEWIERNWKPTVDGCRLLILDSLKVHKMNSVREALEGNCTQVEFVPPGITGISQPMDVAVMKPFKDAVRRFYLQYHIDHPFPTSTTEKRALLSRFVAEAWDQVTDQTIVRGFVKAGIVPTGPRDELGRFRVSDSFDEAPIVENA